MLLPVTHFLYLASVLLLAALGVLLCSRTNNSIALTRNAMFAGIILCAAAFGRFWGDNRGQALALTLMFLWVVSAFLLPRPRRSQEQS